MMRNAAKQTRTAIVTQHCRPMDMTRSQAPAERAGGERRLACDMAAEEEAEGPASAAGGTIRVSSAISGLA
jgi:hypothetical protein